MKLVAEVIWSEICNDDTSIALFNFGGELLTAPVHRHDDRILDFDTFEVYAIQYYPNFNRLDLILDYPEKKEEPEEDYN